MTAVDLKPAQAQAGGRVIWCRSNSGLARYFDRLVRQTGMRRYSN